MLRWCFGLIACACMAADAQAIELSQKGAVAFLSGSINDGDQFKLRDFLASPQGQQIRVIYLDSTGGRILEAKEMARHIRNANIATAVDARKSRCFSACTGLFTAGVQRHYVNASAVADGEGGRDVGLGFHEGNVLQRDGKRGYSGYGTSEMVNIYYEMRVPGAAQLITRSTFRNMFKVSAQTAMSTGIATSLAAP